MPKLFWNASYGGRLIMRGLGTSTTLDTNHTKKVVVKLMCPLVGLLVA